MAYSFYFMQENTFLGDSLAIVYKLSARDRLLNNLTGDNIVIFIKFGKKLNINKKNISFKDLISNNNFKSTKPILLRLSSECLLGMFGDSHCDCEMQRVSSLNAINTNGQGVYIQLPQEAQGRGLFYKAQELSLQVTGHNSQGEYIGEKSILEACKYLIGNENVDIRDFKFLHKIFKELNLDKLDYVLITDSIRKVKSLSQELKVNIIGNIQIRKSISINNVAGYLEKIYSSDYTLEDKDIVEIINLIANSKTIPNRALIMISKIEELLNTNDRTNINKELLTLLCDSAKKYKRIKKDEIL